MQVNTSSLLANLEAKNVKNATQKITPRMQNSEAFVPVAVSAKSKSIGNLMDSLFRSLTTSANSKENISQILKSPEITKNIQNPLNTLQTLSNELAREPALQSFAKKIEHFFVQLKDIDAKVLQAQVKNSGPFMESKFQLLEQTPNALPQNLQTVLKAIAQNLQTSQGVLVPKQDLDLLVKTFFEQLASVADLEKGLIKDVQKMFANLSNDGVIKHKNFQDFVKFETLFKDIQKSQLANSLEAIKNVLVKNTNTQLQNVKIQTIAQNLLHVSKNNQIFEPIWKNIQENIAQIKLLPPFKSPLLEVIAKLDTSINASKLTESKINNASVVGSQELQNLQDHIKHIVQNIKVQIPLQNSDTITKIIDTLLKKNDLFAPQQSQLFESSSQLEKLSQLLKNDLKPQEIKQLQTLKEIIHFEKILHKETQLNRLHVPLKIDNISLLKQELSSDIKSTLLGLKDALQNLSSVKQSDTLMQHIDKTLSSIDFYQLSSHVNQSSSSYLPFLWQDLEKGELSFKRLRENRFYCEINLSLKQYGNIDLMLLLHDDICIDLSVYAQNKAFITQFENNLKEYKKGLNDLGLILLHVQFYDMPKDAKIKKQTYDFVKNEQIDMGINIKV
ncbi:MAG: hypothetical protein IBX44_04420 [Sulfurospirillum sp.]|nr:hypothetical protein [Sulfurospirillum sp.]